MSSKHKHIWCIAVIGLLCMGPALVQAQVGTVFTYQGQLKQAGEPVTDSADFRFGLWDAETGGAEITYTIETNVPVEDGLFTVEVDFGTGVFEGDERWLEIEVAVPPGDPFTPLAGRQPIRPTPYALYAVHGGDSYWAADGDDIYNANSGNVGVGTDAPEHPLHVSGNFRSDGRVALGNDGIFGPGSLHNWIFDASHTITDFSETLYWKMFYSWFRADPTADLTGANKRYLYSHDFQIYVPETNDKDIEYMQGPYLGAFQFGTGTINLLAGVELICASFAGHVGFQIGAEATSEAAETASITDNVGFRIETGHRGTEGFITNNYGIHMITPHHDRPLDNHYGIYLEDQDFGTNDSYAIYVAGGDTHLNGDLNVTGTVSKGGGSFKIDHPLDPENKYLYHSFVESPDMMNVYNGNAVLDDQGEVVVTLPEWFEVLNRDFRYQLTAIGAPGPNLYIAEKIQDNRFKIAGGKTGLEVSWQVTGIRQDAFANANRIPVEQDKPDYARGYYLHPEAHGQSADLDTEHARQAHRGTPSSAATEALEKGLRRPARRR